MHSFNIKNENIKAEQLVFDGVSIIAINLKSNTPSTVNIDTSRFCWFMHFITEECAPHHRGTPYAFINCRCITHYADTVDTAFNVAGEAKIYSVCLTRKLTGKFIDQDFFNASPKSFHDGLADPRAKAIVAVMQDAYQTGNAGRIFLESKILELLGLQLKQITQNKMPPDSVSKHDAERLHDARAILIQNLQTPCSLMELARRTGLNDFKLKRGFKILFGNTVFGYLFQLRMETAYHLLHQEKA